MNYGAIVLGLAVSGCSSLVISKVLLHEVPTPNSFSVLRVTVDNTEAKSVDFKVAYYLPGHGRKLSPPLTIAANATEQFQVQISSIGLKNSFGISGPFWVCVDTTEEAKPKIVKFDYPTSTSGFASPIDSHSHDLNACPDPFNGP
jgi:hypothetical protein